MVPIRKESEETTNAENVMRNSVKTTGEQNKMLAACDQMQKQRLNCLVLFKPQQDVSIPESCRNLLRRNIGRLSRTNLQTVCGYHFLSGVNFTIPFHSLPLKVFVLLLFRMVFPLYLKLFLIVCDCSSQKLFFMSYIGSQLFREICVFLAHLAEHDTY